MFGRSQQPSSTNPQGNPRQNKFRTFTLDDFKIKLYLQVSGSGIFSDSYLHITAKNQANSNKYQFILGSSAVANQIPDLCKNTEEFFNALVDAFEAKDPEIKLAITPEAELHYICNARIGSRSKVITFRLKLDKYLPNETKPSESATKSIVKAHAKEIEDIQEKLDSLENSQMSQIQKLESQYFSLSETIKNQEHLLSQLRHQMEYVNCKTQQIRIPGCFGGNPSVNTENASGATGGGIFGNGPAGDPTTSSRGDGGLFGGSSKPAESEKTSSEAPSGGGLFSKPTNSPTTTSGGGGLFGNANKPAESEKTSSGGGLFQNFNPGDTVRTTGTPGGGLFADKPTTSQGSSLFASIKGFVPGPNRGGGPFGNSSQSPKSERSSSSDSDEGIFAKKPMDSAIAHLRSELSNSTSKPAEGEKTSNGATGGRGLFSNQAGNSSTAPSGGLFSNSTSKPAESERTAGGTACGGSLFENKPSNSSTAPSGGLFSNSTSKPVNSEQTSSGGGSLFGGQTSGTTVKATGTPGGGLFANKPTNSPPTSSLFANSGKPTESERTASGTACGGSLFGNKPTNSPAPTSGGLFGDATSKPANSEQASSGGRVLFGGKAGPCENTENPSGVNESSGNNQKTSNGSGSLFGGQSTTKSGTEPQSLFGSNPPKNESTSSSERKGLFGKVAASTTTEVNTSSENNGKTVVLDAALFGTKPAKNENAGTSENTENKSEANEPLNKNDKMFNLDTPVIRCISRKQSENNGNASGENEEIPENKNEVVKPAEEGSEEAGDSTKCISPEELQNPAAPGKNISRSLKYQGSDCSSETEIKDKEEEVKEKEKDEEESKDQDEKETQDEGEKEKESEKPKVVKQKERAF